MGSLFCCFKWLKFSNKVRRSGGVKHDPSKHGHYRAGASPGVYQRRKVSRMAGTISMEDLQDEGTSRSHSESDRSRAASLAPAENHHAAGNSLTVPMHGMGKKRFGKPKIAVSTPDLQKAQEDEQKMKFSHSNLTDNKWLSSQSITNLSMSNYQMNISSRPSSPKATKQSDTEGVFEKHSGTEKSETTSVNELPEVDQDTKRVRKRDYLAMPFHHLKNKLSSSTSDLTSKKPVRQTSKSSFYLEDVALSSEKETIEESAVVAKQHGLNLQMYLNDVDESLAASQSINKKVDSVQEEYSYGSVILIAGYQNGQLKVTIKKIQNLPYKGMNPNQYSVLIKLQLMPENKKHPARLCGQNGDKKSPNPIMDEDFQWNSVVIHADSYLCISVYEKGRQEKYDAIGHILLPLNMSELRKFKQISAQLHKTSAPSWNKGLVHLSFHYSENCIQMTIYQVKDLEINGVKCPDELNIYLKATLYVKGKKEKSEKSKKMQIQDSSGLFFNEEFKLQITSNSNLPDSLIVLTVAHKSGKFGNDINVGKIVLGPYYFLKGEQTDWGRVILAKQAVTSWYKLQMID